MSKNEIFGETIYAYTRAQAIEDGFLVDLSEIAREAGFKIPVAVTSAVWEEYIAWTEEDTDNQTIQNQSGRLWDVLRMLLIAIKKAPSSADRLNYQLSVIPRDGKSQHPKLIELKALIDGGDNGDPVITIMLPNED